MSKTTSHAGARIPLARRKTTSTPDLSSASKTRERILDAAKRIYQERDFSSVRTADISEASGANIALVNYYFGSKMQLFREVFEEACDAVAREREEGLRKLLANESKPDMAGLIRAWVLPAISSTRSPQSRMLTSQLLGLVLASEASEGIREAFARSLARVDALYAEQIQRLRPDLSAEAVSWRMLSAIGAYALVTGHPALIELMPGGFGGRARQDEFDVEDELLRWLVAAMDAPSGEGQHLTGQVLEPRRARRRSTES
jgi:AcrR family transcriptional regulator